MRLTDIDEVYKILSEYYHHRTDFQHMALKDALDRVPTVNIDSIITTHEEIGYEQGRRDGYAEALEEIEHVRYGQWKQNIYHPHIIFCNVCGKPYELSNSMECWSYCPKCGTRMDEVKK